MLVFCDVACILCCVSIVSVSLHTSASCVGLRVSCIMGTPTQAGIPQRKLKLRNFGDVSKYNSSSELKQAMK